MYLLIRCECAVVCCSNGNSLVYDFVGVFCFDGYLLRNSVMYTDGVHFCFDLRTVLSVLDQVLEKYTNQSIAQPSIVLSIK